MADPAAAGVAQVVGSALVAVVEVLPAEEPAALAVVRAVLRWPAVLALVTAAPVVLAQPMAVLVVALEAEDSAEALLDLLSRQSFSAAMARSTT